MPRAPRRCAKPGCKEKFPCPRHPRGWASSTSPELPSNWGSLKKRARGYIDKRCYVCGRIDPNGQVDHIVPRSQGGLDTPSNLAWICDYHHKRKTHEESKRGKRSNGNM